jgi:hypothetical protein
MSLVKEFILENPGKSVPYEICSELTLEDVVFILISKTGIFFGDEKYLMKYRKGSIYEIIIFGEINEMVLLMSMYRSQYISLKKIVRKWFIFDCEVEYKLTILDEMVAYFDEIGFDCTIENGKYTINGFRGKPELAKNFIDRYTKKIDVKSARKT